jgi:hypothetical protein
VPKAEFERVLADMHRQKEAKRAAETELTTLRQSVEELQTKLAAGNSDFKALFEAEKAKHAAAKAEADGLKKAVHYNERYRAAYPELKKAGLRNDAENLIDAMKLDTIEIEATSNGRFLCNGVDKFIEAAKATFPYAFEKPQTPIVNGGTGSGTPGAAQQWTPKALFELEQQCKAKRDMGPYHAAVAEWRKQQQRA